MRISMETMRLISIFFSPKEAQLLFRQLQKSPARKIAVLKCDEYGMDFSLHMCTLDEIKENIISSTIHILIFSHWWLTHICLCCGTVQTGWFMRLKKIKMAMHTHTHPPPHTHPTPHTHPHTPICKCNSTTSNPNFWLFRGDFEIILWAKSKIGHHCDGRNFFSQLSFLSSQKPRHFMYITWINNHCPSQKHQWGAAMINHVTVVTHLKVRRTEFCSKIPSVAKIHLWPSITKQHGSRLVHVSGLKFTLNPINT